jgi:lysozyme
MWRGGVPIEVIHMSQAFEGFRVAPYLCDANVWTIGYGSTRDLFGKPVTRDTPAITETQAMVMKTRDLDQAARLAAKAFPDGLPARWGAVVVLMCNNMGDITRWGATLHRMLLAGDWPAAAHQMRLYRNGAGKPLLGLRRRRWAEAAYALGMDAAEAHRRAWAEIKHVDDWPALPAS